MERQRRRRERRIRRCGHLSAEFLRCFLLLFFSHLRILCAVLGSAFGISDAIIRESGQWRGDKVGSGPPPHGFTTTRQAGGNFHKLSEIYGLEVISKVGKKTPPQLKTSQISR